MADINIPFLMAGMQLSRSLWHSKTPTAYLYNGVQLPALPEWDRSVYPYAFIALFNSKYYLYVTTSPIIFADSTYFGISVFSKTAGTVLNYTQTEEGGWEAGSTTEYGSYADGSSNFVYTDGKNSYKYVIWTNTDVYYGDELYLAASDPIPVYE